MFASIRCTLTNRELTKGITDSQLISYYLNIKDIPCLINSPLREDKKPSFGLFTSNGSDIYYKDFSTGDSGNILDLLLLLLDLTTLEELEKRIALDYNNILEAKPTNIVYTYSKSYEKEDIEYKIKIIPREFTKEDLEYWLSYGVTKAQLEYADVYSIKAIIINGTLYHTDKLAFAYLEVNNNVSTYKIYQPKSLLLKWLSSHSSSVVSLYHKLPPTYPFLFICSSVKDALCLWSLTSIPCIALQNENVNLITSIALNLKQRFNAIFVLYDNDEAGIKGGKKLASNYNFNYLELPNIDNKKDISDLYQHIGANKLKTIIKQLIINYHEASYRSSN